MIKRYALGRDNNGTYKVYGKVVLMDAGDDMETRKKLDFE